MKQFFVCIAFKQIKRVLQGLSSPCATCGYYECSYCDNCHNPDCSSSALCTQD